MRLAILINEVDIINEHYKKPNSSTNDWTEVLIRVNEADTWD
jgi:hypothetical protein